MINDFGRNKDLTLNYRTSGTGMGFTRSCSRCEGKRPALGGKTCKVTKRWTCALCVAAMAANAKT